MNFRLHTQEKGGKKTSEWVKNFWFLKYGFSAFICTKNYQKIFKTRRDSLFGNLVTLGFFSARAADIFKLPPSFTLTAIFYVNTIKGKNAFFLPKFSPSTYIWMYMTVCMEYASIADVLYWKKWYIYWIINSNNNSCHC